MASVQFSNCVRLAAQSAPRHANTLTHGWTADLGSSPGVDLHLNFGALNVPVCQHVLHGTKKGKYVCIAKALSLFLLRR